MRIRQSDLAAWARCPRQKHLRDVARERGDGEEILSATIFGTVTHYSVMLLEQLHLEGREDACERAVEAFEHYWLPDNVTDLDPRATSITWLPRQSWGGLQIRGRNTIRDYYEVLRNDNGVTLALEYPFTLPVDLPTQGTHEAHGTIDRLVLRVKGTRSGTPYLSVEDYKTGKKPTYLRYAAQWTLYSWASLQADFWEAFRQAGELDRITEPLAQKGYALYADGSGRPVIPRRGRWVSLREQFSVHDAGWRTETDYARLMIAMDEYVRSCEAGIYPLNLTGDPCYYCPFSRNGMCAGIPLAEENEGEPM